MIWKRMIHIRATMLLDQLQWLHLLMLHLILFFLLHSFAVYNVFCKNQKLTSIASLIRTKVKVYRMDGNLNLAFIKMEIRNFFTLAFTEASQMCDSVMWHWSSTTKSVMFIRDRFVLKSGGSSLFVILIK